MSKKSFSEAIEEAREAVEKLNKSMSIGLKIYALTNEEYDIEWLSDIAESWGYDLEELFDIWQILAKRGEPYNTRLLIDVLELKDSGMPTSSIKTWLQLEITRRHFNNN